MVNVELLEWIKETEASYQYDAEFVKMEFAVALERIMDQQGVNRKELAERIGSSPAAITMALRGDANLTIDRMVKMVHALKAKMHINIARNDCKVAWYETHTTKEQNEPGITWAKATHEGGGSDLKLIAG